VDVVLDNDVMLKAACYSLHRGLWPELERGRVGVLGAARYVLATHVERRAHDVPRARAALEDLLHGVEELEPSDDELTAAADLEQLAARLGLPLDAGETQLIAIVAARDTRRFDTGDKRAIAAAERLIAESPPCAALVGRVMCLEQLFLRLVTEHSSAIEDVRRAVCDEIDADRAISICFSCYSREAPDVGDVVSALKSYVEALRGDARRVLAP
jgi:hypothetical protein